MSDDFPTPSLFFPVKTVDAASVAIHKTRGPWHRLSAARERHCSECWVAAHDALRAARRGEWSLTGTSEIEVRVSHIPPESS